MKAKATRNIVFLVLVVLLTSGTYVSGQTEKVKVESGWIRGTAESWSDGEQLAKIGVVFVSITYRVGQHGLNRFVNWMNS